MIVLSGVVYMMKSRGRRTELEEHHKKQCERMRGCCHILHEKSAIS